MNDLNDIERMRADLIAGAAINRIEQRHNLQPGPVNLGTSLSDGDGSYYDEDGERQMYLRAGDVLDSAPVGP